jgi:hypothetical protein
MLHRTRIWTLTDVAACRPDVLPTAPQADRLAFFLTQCTWTACSGFHLENLLFLNDATSPDGAQEYAVVHEEDGSFYQIESITFSWLTQERAAQVIQRLLSNPQTGFRSLVNPTLEVVSTHWCGHCS